ncbi:MAG: RNA methyltransferase [Chitinophagales bacterium]
MYGKFLVEGDKLVRELLQSDFKIEAVYSLANYILVGNHKEFDHFVVSETELKKISTHQNPNNVVAVAHIPIASFYQNKLPEQLFIACDNLSDPGNAGTIIRTAEWFGIHTIFFSKNSVEIYNPKVVSAAKGSLFRTKCIYTDLRNLFAANPDIPVYGTFMNGTNIYESRLPKSAFIIIGNEANGISEELAATTQHKLSIPPFGQAESLNAAVAAAIIMSEFKRR